MESIGWYIGSVYRLPARRLTEVLHAKCTVGGGEHLVDFDDDLRDRVRQPGTHAYSEANGSSGTPRRSPRRAPSSPGSGSKDRAPWSSRHRTTPNSCACLWRCCCWACRSARRPSTGSRAGVRVACAVRAQATRTLTSGCRLSSNLLGSCRGLGAVVDDLAGLLQPGFTATELQDHQDADADQHPHTHDQR